MMFLAHLVLKGLMRIIYADTTNPKATVATMEAGILGTSGSDALKTSDRLNIPVEMQIYRQCILVANFEMSRWAKSPSP